MYRQLIPDEEGFVPVQPRQRRIRGVTGCDVSESHGLEGAPSPVRYLPSSRVKRGDADAVTAFLVQRQINALKKEKVPHDNANTDASRRPGSSG